MKLLRFLDRKFTLSEQKNYVIGYLLFGLPLTEVLKFFLFKSDFSFEKLLVTYIVNLIILSPLLINYVRHTRKYKGILKEALKNEKISVKALFDFDGFKKNEIYICDNICNTLISALAGSQKSASAKIVTKYFKSIILVNDSNHRSHNLKNIINKFEINDIKRERLKKLKKIKRTW